MTPRALLFTDVVDSTLLVERLGDARAAELWAEHDRRARDLLALHHGREIDRTDGFFLLFDTAAEAARYALAYHHAIADLELSARVGLHVGDVTLRENSADDVARGAKRTEVEGLAKPFAARVMALARGGQTLLSAAAHSALGTPPGEGAELESHGHYNLKGVEGPVEIFELGLRASAAFTPPADADKAYRVVRADDLWRPLREVRHNLPPERDAFVGRHTELRTLAQRLDAGARLLTVLGPGGTGKTRFVRRYGAAWLGDWPGGVYFCDLSEARSLDGVYFAAALALGVPLGKGDPGVQLGHAIAARGRCLVILDNFEQVLTHAQPSLGRWLDRAAEAAFVVTSRERLHLQGEEIFPVEPLPLDGDAIELFAARARAQRSDFVVSDANRRAVAEVVRLLDGLPLAIELAAARVAVLSPAQLVLRMKDRFRLLAGAHGAAARQATLKAAIDWSWDLLTPWEQAALAQCAVFEGGFTLEAAEAVLDLARWPEAPPVMDAVQALVDKSLLRAWEPARHARLDIDERYFGMYLSIHEYALGKLDAGGPQALRAAEVAHGRHFASFGSEAAIEACSRHGGVQRLRALALELDNLVSACRRAIARGDGAIAVPAYRAAWEVLDRQGPFTLGILLGAQVLALDGIDPAQRAEALLAQAQGMERAGRTADAGSVLDAALTLTRTTADRRREGIVLAMIGGLHREQGDMDVAQRHLEAALAIHRAVGNRLGEASVLSNLGNLFDQRGQPAQSRWHHEAALTIHRDLGNRRSEGNVLACLGILHRHQGRMDDSHAHYEAALAIHRELGDRRSEGIALGNLGNVHLDQGRAEQAQAHYEAALAIHREVGSRIVEAYALANLGSVHREHHRLDQARAHFDQALAISREVGDRYHEGRVLGCLGQLNRDQGRTAQALELYEQALLAHRVVGNRREEGVVLGSLADLLAGQGRVGEALEMLVEAEALLRDVDNPLELAALLCVKGRAEVASGALGLARATLDEAESIGATLAAGPESGLGREITRLRELLA